MHEAKGGVEEVEVVGPVTLDWFDDVLGLVGLVVEEGSLSPSLSCLSQRGVGRWYWAAIAGGMLRLASSC